MGKQASQAKGVWVVGFGVKSPKRHNKNNSEYMDDFAFVLDKTGHSSFVPWSELELDTKNIVSDAYLLEALSELHDNASTSFGLYHLQPASTPEIADFLVQAHIIPLLRDLEIIEHGVMQAMQRHDFSESRGDVAISMFFKQRFDAIKKIEQRIRQEQSSGRKPKAANGSHAQQGLALLPS